MTTLQPASWRANVSEYWKPQKPRRGALIPGNSQHLGLAFLICFKHLFFCSAGKNEQKLICLSADEKRRIQGLAQIQPSKAQLGQRCNREYYNQRSCLKCLSSPIAFWIPSPQIGEGHWHLCYRAQEVSFTSDIAPYLFRNLSFLFA